MTIKILNDGRCACSADIVCPLGRVGSQNRCTAEELTKVDHPIEYLGTFGSITKVRPVRAFVENDVLIQEFEIVDGPRAGEILTLRTRMQK